MGYERICTRCGAHLDPGERWDPCEDCRREMAEERERRRVESGKEKEPVLAGEGR
jgi:hypothetical protein